MISYLALTMCTREWRRNFFNKTQINGAIFTNPKPCQVNFSLGRLKEDISIHKEP
jgi:hypothetical protein